MRYCGAIHDMKYAMTILTKAIRLCIAVVITVEDEWTTCLPQTKCLGGCLERQGKVYKLERMGRLLSHGNTRWRDNT